MSRPSARRGLSEREMAALRVGQLAMALPEPVRELMFMVAEFFAEEMRPHCGSCGGSLRDGQRVTVCIRSDPDRSVMTVQLQHDGCAEQERAASGYQERAALAN